MFTMRLCNLFLLFLHNSQHSLTVRIDKRALIDEWNLLSDENKKEAAPDDSSKTSVKALQTSEKAGMFDHRQLHSVLDAPEALTEPDSSWVQMLESGACDDGCQHAAAVVHVAFPEAPAVEESFAGAVSALADSLSSAEAFASFYRLFDWSDAEAYFAKLGDSQLMVVDIDNNDVDDRLAIVILAYQMASANAERRRLQSPDAKCTLLLDARTWRTTSGLVLWRTLQLATRLNRLLARYGVSIEPVLGDRNEVLHTVAAYLKVPKQATDYQAREALEKRGLGTGYMLQVDGVGGSWSDLRSCWRGRQTGPQPAAVWVLGGLCHEQVDDLEQWAGRGARFVIMEQAQPAWQSVVMPPAWDSELQPPATSYDPDTAPLSAFGAEASNVRSSEAGYSATIEVYLRYQQLAEKWPSRVVQFHPAMARKGLWLPVPPGQAMQRIHGRPFNVKVVDVALGADAEYEVVKALDKDRLASAFSSLLLAAKTHCSDTLYAELSINGYQDDLGEDRPSMKHIVKYGSFHSDGIAVILAARPTLAGVHSMTRRLAIVKTA